MSYWPLIGVALVVLGFALRMNPALVVVGAGVVTGLVAGYTPVAVLELLGEAFTKQRYLAIFLLTLPVIGLLERHGLKERAQAWIATLRGATAGRLLIVYLAARQLTAALGLNSLGGHPQTVRPLLSPMAEGAAEARNGRLPEAERERLKALSAATDNVGLFFGEDIFIAFGAVLLMQGFFAENGIVLEPLHIALWGIPTALCAFAIHGARLSRLDGRLAREAARLQAGGAGGDTAEAIGVGVDTGAAGRAADIASSGDAGPASWNTADPAGTAAPASAASAAGAADPDPEPAAGGPAS
ncbi:DUF969 domain-containing protein [Luteimonas sp. SJ-92]|uniref:DUF969 domain-containing protein n=1 Tax=Luteimonas salinisoli TaxID=2752307 RepID=A0A853JAY6_9GAMM|nr:DUF969 domain-containing protein [Luteimonas salinisoli]NZA25904.1 DUF969 domain-containing protein [Luteimonas salinisoli]